MTRALIDVLEKDTGLVATVADASETKINILSYTCKDTYHCNLSHCNDKSDLHSLLVNQHLLK